MLQTFFHKFSIVSDRATLPPLGATAVSVELAGSAEEVVLRVADDGVGPREALDDRRVEGFRRREVLGAGVGRRARETAGISQEELAERRAGVPGAGVVVNDIAVFHARSGGTAASLSGLSGRMCCSRSIASRTPFAHDSLDPTVST